MAGWTFHSLGRHERPICPLRTRVSWEELKDNHVIWWSLTPECQSMVCFCSNIRDRFLPETLTPPSPRAASSSAKRNTVISVLYAMRLYIFLLQIAICLVVARFIWDVENRSLCPFLIPRLIQGIEFMTCFWSTFCRRLVMAGACPGRVIPEAFSNSRLLCIIYCSRFNWRTLPLGFSTCSTKGQISM